jgi:hypothetical protein
MADFGLINNNNETGSLPAGTANTVVYETDLDIKKEVLDEEEEKEVIDLQQNQDELVIKQEVLDHSYEEESCGEEEDDQIEIKEESLEDEQSSGQSIECEFCKKGFQYPSALKR